MGEYIGLEFLLSWMIAVILIFPIWKICSKAGKNPGISLLSLIPFFGFVVVCLILAFSNWPSVSKEVVEDKQQGEKL